MILASIVLAICVGLQNPATQTTAPPPSKLALIVGVAKYPDSIAKTLPGLSGPRNDAEEARSLLATRFGFDADSIQVLVDDEATHEGVVRAFHDHLIARAGPGTEVVFWYSGHGAQVPDASGFEASGFDSTLVLSDSRSASLDGQYDLTDDELSSLLDALAAKDAHVLVVTDACHSGGVTRGGRHPKSAPRGARALAKQLLAPFWPKDVELKDDDGAHHDRPDLVHIAACATDQEAQEHPFEQPDGSFVTRGCLTHGLCWFLNAAQPGESFRSVADRTALWVEGFEPDQTPQCEGTIDRELFSGKFATRPKGFSARLGDGRQIEIDGGRLHGIRPSTHFTIADESGNKIGIAHASYVGAGDSAALWDGNTPANAKGVALRAVPIAGTGGREPLVLRVADPGIATLLAERFKDRILIATAAAPDGYSLEFEKIAGEKPGLNGRFSSLDGIPLWHAEWSDVANESEFATSKAFDAFLTEFDAALENETVHRETTALPSEPGTLRLVGTLAAPDTATLEYLRRGPAKNAVAAKIEPLADAAGVLKTYRALFDPKGPDLPVAELTLENPGKDPVYVCVISVSEDRDRTIIFPEEGARDEVLPSGGARTFSIALNGDAKQRFDRELRDRILLIATKRPVDFFTLSAKTSYRSSGAPSVLERAFRGGVTRGGGDDEFGITAIDVWVPGS